MPQMIGSCINWEIAGLLGRMVVINLGPFFLVFQLLIRRRQQALGRPYSELSLVAREVQIVGLLGYYVILSIFFLSIPVLRYLNTQPGYDILLIEPDGYAVFLIALISFALVVGSVYLRYRRIWAYQLIFYLLTGLLVYAFFSVLEWGVVSVVPVLVFAYLLFRLRRPSLRSELFGRRA